MKKFLALILSIVMMLSVVAIAPIGASAAEVDSAPTSLWWGMIEYQVLADDTVEILHYYDYAVDATIPSYIDGHAVTVIGNQAFRYTSTRTVKLPTTLKRIENMAFANCTYLESIDIPMNVTYIAPNAFLSCYGLKSITVDRYNTVYDSREDCNALIETATNTIIRGCDNSTIPTSVEHIGDSAFERCRGLTELSLNVKTVGKNAFLGCVNLEGVTVDSVEFIGEDAFNLCSSLSWIEFFDAKTEIFDSATTIPENAQFGFFSCGIFSKAFDYALKYDRVRLAEHSPSLFTAVGSEGLFGSNWDTTDENNWLEVGSDWYRPIWSKTYSNVKAGTYEFKVIVDSEWNEYEMNLDGFSYGKPNSVINVPYNGSKVIISCDGRKAYVEVIAPERPAMVENVHCTNIESDEFTVEWNANDYVDTYYVYVDGKSYGSTKSTSLVVPNRKKGTTYEVKVTAKLTDGSWLNLDLAQVVSVTTLNKVENLKVTDVAPFSITIEWDETPDAVGYWVYANDGAYKYTTETSMEITKRVPETLYNISVVAAFGDGSLFDKKDALVVTVTTDDIGPITSTTRYDFPLDEVKGAEKAWILYGKSADKMVVFNTVDVTKDTFTIANLDYDTDYYYGFTYIKNGKAYTSTPKLVHTETNETFDDITATVTNEGKLVINWNQVNQAYKYWIFKNGGIVATPATNSALTFDSYDLNDEFYIEGTYKWQDGTRQFKYDKIKLSDILK